MNKILILNGSPKANGTIAQILKSVKGNGITDINYINVYDLNINFCVGCMKCRSEGKCKTFVNDDVEMVRNLIEEASILIVGSPTYFGSMSAKLKSLFERLVPTFMAENKLGIPIRRQKNKKAIIVTSRATRRLRYEIPEQSVRVAANIEKILKPAGYKVKIIEITGTGYEPNRIEMIKYGKIRINEIITGKISLYILIKLLIIFYAFIAILIVSFKS